MNKRIEHMLNFGSGKRLPIILQAEIAECGLACFAMIASYHGYQTDLVSLRKKFVISNHGTNLQQIMNMASRLELAGRALKLDIGQLGQLQLPCVLHWGMDHFVVLKTLKRNNAIIHDPELGERKVNLDEISAKFSGVALELTPTSEFIAEKVKNTLSLNHFWSKITGLKSSLTNILVLALLLQFFAIISPLYMQTVVDEVLLRNDTYLLVTLAIGFGLLLFIQIGTSFLREHLILQLANSLNIQMASNLFRHLIRLPMEYFSMRHMGDIVSRFSSLTSVREILTNGVLTAIIDGLLAVITLVVMLLYSPRLTFIVVIAVFTYALLRYLLFRPLRVLTEEQIAAAARQDTHFMESVRAIQTIKLFEKENDRQSQWQNVLVNSINKAIRIERWNINYRTTNQLLFGLENLIVIYFAALDVMDSVITLGMFYAFMNYKARFTSSVNSFIERVIEIKMLDVHLGRLADIAFTAQDEHIKAKENSPQIASIAEHTLPPLLGNIEVRNLGYRYGENEPPVFHNVNFTIEAGETVVFTGPSGCGKTTLVKCLMGLLTPYQGNIYIDGQELNKIPYYRSHIAAVMQEDQLLSGTIAENIACFDTEFNMQKVYSCANMACIHEDISRMPMQYNTLVGDMGSSLSGGQLQRVILARALYREPRILFLDEATSHLDIDNEARISEHIKQLAITRVMVAHRPETINAADRLIALTTSN